MRNGAFPDPVAETFLDAALRLLAEQVNLQLQCNDWAEKYGVEHENDVFMMHPFCWCERQDCPWCGGGAPNFWYKPTNFKVWWYKYIGRDMQTNRNYTGIEVYQILTNCLRSIGS